MKNLRVFNQAHILQEKQKCLDRNMALYRWGCLFFFLICPPYFFFAFPCDCKACILVHRRPSLSTTARARGYGDRSGWTLVASFTKWISGKRRSPLARHATMQTPQIEKKNKHYIQIRIIHIKNMKQVLHINACIQKKNMCDEDKGSLMCRDLGFE